MSTVIAAIIILAIVGVVITFLNNLSGGGKQDYPYRLADSFLSKAELSFFGVLRQAVGDNGIIFAKVRIADVLATKRGLSNSQRQTAQNKINMRHFDFIVCEKGTAKPLVAIELDDSSHNRKSQVARDKFVNRASEAAELPLLRIPAKAAYPIAQLKEQLKPHLGLQPEPQLQPHDTKPDKSAGPPSCPKCGSGMVRRQGKTDALAGKEFWGCEQYPRCRSVLPIGA